ncbi:MAG: alpha/beta fold hydrolase [Dehalococcoidia bacterium]
MPTVKVGDIGIYYEIHGEGEALVLIMGYGANSGEWFRQIPFLSREYRVVAFDNRGAGRSDKPDVPYTMPMLAQDIAGLLEALAIDVAHIYGVSMGGMIAQEFALCYPQRVISLILGCTLCGGTHTIMPDEEVMTVLFDMERMERLTSEEEARELLPFTLTQEFIDNNPDIVEQAIAKRLEYVTPPHGFVRQAEAIMGHDTYERLPQIKAPTLVIAGTGDRLIPVENSRILASRIPNAELVLFEGAGHGFLLEVEEEANKAVLDFLRRHPRPS